MLDQGRGHELAHRRDVGPVVRSHRQASLTSADQHLRVCGEVQLLVLALDDFTSDAQGIRSRKWVTQRRHLVQQAAQSPNICLVGVGLMLDDLGAEVQDCADHGLHHRSTLRAPQLLPRQPEVCHLHCQGVRLHQDVVRRQVAVHDAFVNMQVAEGKAYLHEDLPCLLLWQLRKALLLRRCHKNLQSHTVAELHDDPQRGRSAALCPCCEGRVVLNNVRVIQLPQQAYFLRDTFRNLILR
mmetsp:Transcript_69975/g.200532  ORF Transcript_69975/g.200532 Transcript_69975/m.200532 type:complete len:240 (+) Transcript_69975:1045-1764(+)